MKLSEKHTKTGKDQCPLCNHEIDAATGIDNDETPKPGDVSICINCAGFLQYSSDMSLQELPKVVFESLDHEVQMTMKRARRVIMIMKSQK